MTDQERIKKLKEGRGYFNFEGVLVERLAGGYRVFGETFTNEMDVINHIQETCSILNESIVTIENRNDGSINCTNLNDE